MIEGLKCEDLQSLTNEMIDTQLSIISNCSDADVVFIPQDSNAHDPFASSDKEVNMPWTLSHVIVHVTASSEESAFLSAELARGVSHREGRSRFEIHWETISTIFNSPIQIFVVSILQFVFGLSHDDSHLEQMRDILKQAKNARP